MDDRVVRLLAHLLVALAIGWIPALIASQKGRRFADWYVYGTLFFIVALVHAVLIKPEVTDSRAEGEPSEYDRMVQDIGLIAPADGPTVDPTVCASCGSKLPEGAEFCPECSPEEEG